MLVIGKKEEETGTVGVRSRAEGDIGAMNKQEFISKIKNEANNLGK